MKKTKMVVIVGPTAAGKTALSLKLAKAFNGEIVSADSMQVYRYMDIGTAKPTKEEREDVPHHLIDIVDPDCEYSAADFKRDAERVISDIVSRSRRVFLVGGTGLYVRALLEGLFDGPGKVPWLRTELEERARRAGREALYRELEVVDPASARRIHPNNIARIIRALEVYHATGRPLSEFHRRHGFGEERFDTLKIGLVRDRRVLYADIEKRVDRMIEGGLLEEVRWLLEAGYTQELKPMLALGYREMTDHIMGRLDFDEAVAELKKNTRNYAKRQLTWFKKDSGIRWFSPDDEAGIMRAVKRFFTQ